MGKKIPAILFILSTLLGCGGNDNLTESQILAQSIKEGSVVVQRDGMEVAAISTMSVLGSLALADSNDLSRTIQSKAVQTSPGFEANCAQAIQAVFDTQFEGAIVVSGSCIAVTGPVCLYNYAGEISFDRLLIGPGRFLVGKFGVSAKVTFPDCSSNIDGAKVEISLRGNASVGDLNILFLNAVMAVSVDTTTGDVFLNPEFLSVVGNFRGLNCLAGLSGGQCFQDGDGDYIDDTKDNCPNVPNRSQSDTDGDGVGDLCDNCPITPNADQVDSDGDGKGDDCLDICAPGLTQCASSSDCPDDLLCLNGCCLGECPINLSPFNLSMTCHEAERLNDSHDIEGSCEAFGHSCNAEGCCEFVSFPEIPQDYCDELDDFGSCNNCFEFDEFGNCLAPTGFCATFFNTVCLVIFVDPESECPPINEELPANFDCSVYGQQVCNDVIGLGLGSKNLTCNGVCCVEP